MEKENPSFFSKNTLESFILLHRPNKFSPFYSLENFLDTITISLTLACGIYTLILFI
jgi:hypothetical protein